MKLVVRIPSSHEAERRYSIDVVLGEFLGLDYRVEVGGEDYRIELGGRRLVIRDRFFGLVGADYLSARNLPVAIELAHPLRAGETIVSLYGDDELVLDGAELHCGIDLFAATFYMLTRWEEIVATNRDPHGRCLARDATTERWLNRCLVNEWTELLWGLLQKLGCTQPRREHTFAVVASHDIDYPRHWSLRTGVVTFGGDLIKRRSPMRAVRTAGAFVAARMGLARDPYDTFDWLMDRSDEEGITSNFNFMTGRWSEHDPPFDFDPRALTRLLARVAKRGHGIGFHPSYNAYNDPQLWKLEHDRLAQLSPQPVVGGREHYLRFAVPETWRIWNANGMEWDSTLGYADREGFPLWDLLRVPGVRRARTPAAASARTAARRDGRHARRLSQARSSSGGGVAREASRRVQEVRRYVHVAVAQLEPRRNVAALSRGLSRCLARLNDPHLDLVMFATERPREPLDRVVREASVELVDDRAVEEQREAFVREWTLGDIAEPVALDRGSEAVAPRPIREVCGQQRAAGLEHAMDLSEDPVTRCERIAVERRVVDDTVERTPAHGSAIRSPTRASAVSCSAPSRSWSCAIAVGEPSIAETAKPSRAMNHVLAPGPLPRSSKRTSERGGRSERPRDEPHDVLRRVPSPGLAAERRFPRIHRMSSSAA